MKALYEAPEVERIDFAAMETIAEVGDVNDGGDKTQSVQDPDVYG